MSATADLSLSVRISDPRPSHCAACFRGAEEGVRFVDFDAAIDRGTFLSEHGAVIDSIDDLHLCEACVRQGMEVLAIKPRLQAAQGRRIAQLERELDALRSYTRELERTIAERPDTLREED